MVEPTEPLLPAPETPLLLEGPKPKPHGLAAHPKRYSAIALAAFLVIAFALGWYFHHRQDEAAEKANQAQRDAIPVVTVVPVAQSPGSSDMLLPGSLAPLTEAALYARATGYVRRRYVDIGDSVRKGQLLAEIDSPDLDAQATQARAEASQADQQLSQARANVGDAQAQVDLAKLTLGRYEVLEKQDSIAVETVDMERQTYASAVATLASDRDAVGAAVQNVLAARANVRRLTSLQDFERLRAPFDGVITARNVDEGALISTAGASLTSTDVSTYTSNAGSSSTSSTSTSSGSTGTTGGTTGTSSSTSGSATELFRIAQVDRLRVFITVPQESATLVQRGAEASVFVQQFAEPFRGQVSRDARALDPSARTLLTEIQISNARHLLMPGMYAQVRFTTERAAPPLLVPGEAIITRASGTTVAVMQPISDADRQKLPDSPNRANAQRVHLQPVTIGRDYGTQVEITGGLKGGEQVIANPGDSAEEGAVMVPQGPQDEASGASGPQGGKPGSSGDKTDDKKKDAKKGNDEKDGQKGGTPAAAIQPPILASAPASAAPTGAAPTPLKGPSDQTPNGLGSPSMTAPMQGSGNKQPGQKGQRGQKSSK